METSQCLAFLTPGGEGSRKAWLNRLARSDVCERVLKSDVGQHHFDSRENACMRVGGSVPLSAASDTGGWNEALTQFVGPNQTRLVGEESAASR